MLKSLLRSIWRAAKKTLTYIGQGIEYIFTGRSEYEVIGEDFPFEKVENTVQAKILLREAQEYLQHRFAITVKQPLVVELFTSFSSWQVAFYQFSGLVGRYRPCELKKEKVHLVYVLKGLSREKCKGVMVHEVVHAFQREQGILAHDKMLREGMSRWLEYKFLLSEGEQKSAQRLKIAKSLLYGRGLRKVLEMEKSMGEKKLLEYLKNL